MFRIKKNQRWLWYAFDKYNKRIVAHCFGDRSNQTLRELLESIKPFKINYVCTDDYKSYSSLLPRNQHIHVVDKNTRFLSFLSCFSIS